MKISKIVLSCMLISSVAAAQNEGVDSIKSDTLLHIDPSQTPYIKPPKSKPEVQQDSTKPRKHLIHNCPACGRG